MSDLISRQAAIEAIHEDILLKPINDSFYRENHEFVTVGYVERTLLAVPSAQVRTQMPSADCISRQDAIDAVAKILSDREGGNAVWWKPVAESVIDDLPSAQPEITRCKYCEHSEKWYGDKSRCFLWNKDGIDVFDDGYCNYGRKDDKYDSNYK